MMQHLMISFMISMNQQQKFERNDFEILQNALQ